MAFGLFVDTRKTTTTTVVVSCGGAQAGDPSFTGQEFTMTFCTTPPGTGTGENCQGAATCPAGQTGTPPKLPRHHGRGIRVRAAGRQQGQGCLRGTAQLAR